MRTMYTKSDNIKIIIGNETDEIIEELFDSFLQIYQENLEQSMTGSEFVFDSADLLYCKCHKISLNRGGLYIDSRKWFKNKKVTKNPKNNDDKCFQCAVTVALTIKIFLKIRKEYRKLCLLLINIIAKKQTFHHIKKTGKDLNQIINQLLLTSCLCLIKVKK